MRAARTEFCVIKTGTRRPRRPHRSPAAADHYHNRTRRRLRHDRRRRRPSPPRAPVAVCTGGGVVGGRRSSYAAADDRPVAQAHRRRRRRRRLPTYTRSTPPMFFFSLCPSNALAITNFIFFSTLTLSTLGRESSPVIILIIKISVLSNYNQLSECRRRDLGTNNARVILLVGGGVVVVLRHIQNGFGDVWS